ncbi:MAG: hypothetical protein JSS66_15890 [Armatimonadetes bacterium]|nr:hypothetical protein [Armatimonadota bacterium]
MAQTEQLAIIDAAIQDRIDNDIPLSHMTFALTRLTDDGLALYLDRYEAPTKLYLMGCPVTDEGMKLLNRCERLEELGLRWTSITTEGLRQIVDKGHLRKLEMNLEGVRKGGFRVISEFDNLVELSFDVRYGDPFIHYLRESASFEFPDEVQELGNLRSLTHLGLRGFPLAEQGLDWLGRLRELRVLDLSNTQALSKELLHLIGARYLEDLHLSNTSMDDETLLALADHLPLRHLGLANTPVTDAGIRSLVKGGTLRSVFAEDVSWSAEACKELLLMPTLEWAELNVEGVPHEYLEEVARSRTGLWFHP